MSTENKTTSQTIANTLEQLTKGGANTSNQLVFNPATGEFETASPNQSGSADPGTINSIVEDGFAKK